MSVKGYLAALPHLIKERDDEKAFRVYLTEAVRLYGEGKTITVPYLDIIEPPPPPPPEDPRSCVEIVHGIWERMRGEKK